MKRPPLPILNMHPDFTAALTSRGFDRHQIADIVESVEAAGSESALHRAAELIQLIFQRLEDDSVAGAALVLALGLGRGRSLEKLAAIHDVSKQYMHATRRKLEAQLGPDFTFLMRQAKKPAAPPDPEWPMGHSADPFDETLTPPRSARSLSRADQADEA